MPRANEEVEQLLQEYADLIAISGGDPFKTRAYEKAARSIGGYHGDVATLDLKGLCKIPNVGKSIAEKVLEYLRTGTVQAVEELRQLIPDGVRALMGIPGLGPKRAMVLYEELQVTSMEELMDALHEGRIRDLKGFGAKTEENLLRGIHNMQQSGGRIQLGAAIDLAEEILRELESLKEARRSTYAGSLRRMCETIGDVDLLVASAKPAAVMDAFASMSYVERVLAKGDTKSSVLTTKGLQVDLRVVEPNVWGAALQYFTGSKAHNIRVREIAVRKGLKLSEYGLFQAKSGKLIVAETEEEVYERLGLPLIPPTLREDRGEVEAAQAGELPDLVEENDIVGDLHTHTDLTDGLAPLGEMIEAARARGYRYYAVTDHAPLLYMQRMTKEKTLKQRDEIRTLGTKGDMTILHGSELNIQPDGSLDWEDEFLEGFDVLVASVHSHFNQTREEMTKRIVRAMESPYVNIIGHPTARMLGKRPPIDVDMEELFKTAVRTGTALEVNSFPDRLDLRDEHVQWARELGVKFAVDTDSHAAPHLNHMRFGVATAQRGWVTRDDVINTWPLQKLRKFLAKGRR
ncbi:MAG TPA: DNA polymerase/3'-5' exonuclease PolX [Actinomycetota bacterium]|jgi:DNA polymerase (family 10)|nr:DNA polymerase/3'-5' exonuclease PolX [Actinomycetota bacterium]